MVQRLPHLLETNNYSLVLILGGSNDLGSLEASEIIPNLDRLHKMVHQKGGKTVALTIPNLQTTVKFWNKRQMGFNQRLRSMSESSNGNMMLAELELSPQLLPGSLTKEQQSEIWDDNIHFTPKGYDVFGDIVFSAIDSYLSSVLK